MYKYELVGSSYKEWYVYCIICMIHLYAKVYGISIKVFEHEEKEKGI